jgi:hypothetical protein
MKRADDEAARVGEEEPAGERGDVVVAELLELEGQDGHGERVEEGVCEDAWMRMRSRSLFPASDRRECSPRLTTANAHARIQRIDGCGEGTNLES